MYLAIVVALPIGIHQLMPIGPLITLVQLGTAYGKENQPIANFPHQCPRIEHPLLESFEDMSISEPTRRLYLACSDCEERLQWFPSVDHYNLCGRTKGWSRILTGLRL